MLPAGRSTAERHHCESDAPRVIEAPLRTLQSVSRGARRASRACEMLRPACLLLALLSATAAPALAGVEQPAQDRRPFVSWPAVMSHDAATGELEAKLAFAEARQLNESSVVDDWSITQSAGLVGQLTCGARALDYRPYCQGGQVLAHHGAVVIKKALQDSIADVRAWLHSSPDSLVLLYLSHVEGDSGCEETARAALDGLGVFTMQCADVSRHTVADVYAKGQRPNLAQGGSLAAVFDCMDERFDSTVNCYTGFLQTCSTGPDDQSCEAWRRMKAYFEQSTSAPGAPGQLTMTQLHWQSTAATITYGTLAGSSILKDEERAGVNRWAAASLRARKDVAETHVNFVELDNVCDAGLDVHQALLEAFPAAAAKRPS